MFALPEAKRVRREDLRDSDESDSGDDGDRGQVDAELEARLNAQIARSLGLDVSATKPAARSVAAAGGSSSGSKPGAGDQLQSHDGPDAEEDDDLGEFEFKLFSTSTSAPKVVLEDQDAKQGDGDIVRKRPAQYYLVTDIPPELKAEYAYAAVSGDDVLARSQQPYWGLEMPWKVTRIVTTRKSGSGSGSGKPTGESGKQHRTGEGDDNDARPRKRPGKKARIAQRTRERAKKDKQEAAKKQQVEKEEHIKDKKKRLNRLKKLRRRAKEKEKKQAGGGDAGGSDSDDGSE